MVNGKWCRNFHTNTNKFEQFAGLDHLDLSAKNTLIDL